jgi:hypothetical protein
MRYFLPGVITLSLALGSAPQDNPPKAKVSRDPLTNEEVALYRAVLDNYANGSAATLNVADKTETLNLSENKECLKGIGLELGNKSLSVILRIDERVTNGKKSFALVDTELQQRKIAENDPQKLMKRAIDDGEKVTEKQLDDSLTKAFGGGAFHVLRNRV